MRAGAALVVVLAATIVAGVSQAARSRPVHGARISCDPGGARTLAVDQDVRVYSIGKKVYGCANAGRRAYLLGTTGFCVGARAIGPQVKVAGTYVGYSIATCGVDSGSTIVYARRLSDGAIVAQHAATTVVGVESHQIVNSLVLRSDGAVAWIATANSIGAPKFVRQVERLDSRGFALLDSGRGIGPASLNLHGTLVGWTDHGTIRSARLR